MEGIITMGKMLKLSDEFIVKRDGEFLDIGFGAMHITISEKYMHHYMGQFINLACDIGAVEQDAVETSRNAD